MGSVCIICGDLEKNCCPHALWYSSVISAISRSKCGSWNSKIPNAQGISLKSQVPPSCTPKSWPRSFIATSFSSRPWSGRPVRSAICSAVSKASRSSQSSSAWSGSKIFSRSLISTPLSVGGNPLGRVSRTLASLR
jgi:hypothetical protein